MNTLSVILLLVSIILATSTAIAVSYLIRYGKIVLDVQDALEDALDVMDSSYKTISDVLELPVMMDTPEVKQVVDRIKESRDAVLYVSNVLAAPFGGIVEDDPVQDGSPTRG